MFQSEAKWVYAQIVDAGATEKSPILNIGSSTLEFRTEQQPWIEALLFKPLRERGAVVYHIDVREGEGIDLRADLMDDADRTRIRALNGQSVLLCNLLEHVEDPKTFIGRAFELLPPGGRLIVTVPRSYPYHRDPIDTMFRPAPEEVAALVPDARVIASGVIDTGSYWDELRRRPWVILRQIFFLPFPFLGWTKWKRSMKKFYWLVKPYQVTGVVLERPVASAAKN